MKHLIHPSGGPRHMPVQRAGPRNDEADAQATMAGFLRVLERLLPTPDNRMSPTRPTWPGTILQEKP